MAFERHRIVVGVVPLWRGILLANCRRGVVRRVAERQGPALQHVVRSAVEVAGVGPHRAEHGQAPGPCLELRGEDGPYHGGALDGIDLPRFGDRLHDGLAKLSGGGRSLRGIVRQRAGNGIGKRRRHTLAHRVETRQASLTQRRRHLVVGLLSEDAATAQHLPKHNGQREDVGAAVERRIGGQLLGWHVAQLPLHRRARIEGLV